MNLTIDELKDLRNVVERIPQFEEKLGVKLENISFSIVGMFLEIHGDFLMDNLNNFDAQHIDISATVYDQDNFILGADHVTIYQEDFLGFETFTIDVQLSDNDLNSIEKIRLYLKPCY